MPRKIPKDTIEIIKKNIIPRKLKISKKAMETIRKKKRVTAKPKKYEKYKLKEWQTLT